MSLRKLAMAEAGLGSASPKGTVEYRGEDKDDYQACGIKTPAAFYSSL
jgi:hypothetical protein